jgi:5'-3' exonuclease
MRHMHAGDKVTIVSGDQDFYQLCDDNVFVWSPIKKILVGIR